MKVTVATLSDSVFTLDVGEDLEIENFKVSEDKHNNFPSGSSICFRLSVRLSLASRVQRSASCSMENPWWT